MSTTFLSIKDAPDTNFSSPLSVLFKIAHILGHSPNCAVLTVEFGYLIPTPIPLAFL